MIWGEPVERIILLCIRFYQIFISPILPPRCRFYPTCSQYAYQAVIKFGWKKGCIAAFNRMVKCHPFNPGGYDPV
ncbi:MAG: membrane protein insertion efficiency factor YidD [Syntrophomonadaceae bacterium]|nr:membrane protein insertion efficiency factor YidD [Syntrophomonadaceae bacterium]